MLYPKLHQIDPLFLLFLLCPLRQRVEVPDGLVGFHVFLRVLYFSLYFFSLLRLLIFQGDFAGNQDGPSPL